MKLGYNELGYNEQTEHIWLVWVVLKEHFPGYNEQNPVITNKIWPKDNIFSYKNVKKWCFLLFWQTYFNFLVKPFNWICF